MPFKAVFASGVLSIYIRGPELDSLIVRRVIQGDLTLHDVLIGEQGIAVGITHGTANTLAKIVQVERTTMKNLSNKIRRETPGYSNKKVRRKKGYA